MPTSTTLSASKKGFSSILVIFGAVLFLALAAFFIFKPTSKNQGNSAPFKSEPRNTEGPQISQNLDEPPLKLKSIGVNLDYYDSKTGKAGDFEFIKTKFNQNRIWMDYGYVIPANMNASGKDKVSLQPIFILPMGTKVYSLVDGVVVDVPKLYSGDYSVMVAKDKNSRWIYETEHVSNPVVKVGDIVKAGQVVAEVSPHDSNRNNGFGLVEIGILKGGQTPEHVCPYAYLGDSIKEDIEQKILAFYKAWEEYQGDSTLYPENYQVPGCLTLDPIEG